MHTRKIAILSAVLLIMAGLAFWVRGPGKRHREVEPVRVFPAFESAAARRIAVDGPAGSYNLHRTEDGWVVGEERHAADGDAVDRFLQDLAALEREAVVSTSVEKRSLYGVDEATGTAVRIEGEGGALIAAFTAGGQGPDPFSGYLLPEGREEVLLVSANLGAPLGRGGEGWRERRIVRFESPAVTSLSIRSEKGDFVLEKGSGGSWTLDGRDADSQAVEDYIDRVLNLRAAGFPGAEQVAGAGFDAPFAEVTVAAGERMVTLAVGALDEELGQRYLRAGDPPVDYLVSRYVAEDLARGEEGFPPPAAEEHPADTPEE